MEKLHFPAKLYISCALLEQKKKNTQKKIEI